MKNRRDEFQENWLRRQNNCNSSSSSSDKSSCQENENDQMTVDDIIGDLTSNADEVAQVTDAAVGNTHECATTGHGNNVCQHNSDNDDSNTISEPNEIHFFE